MKKVLIVILIFFLLAGIAVGALFFLRSRTGSENPAPPADETSLEREIFRVKNREDLRGLIDRFGLAEPEVDFYYLLEARLFDADNVMASFFFDGQGVLTELETTINFFAGETSEGEMPVPAAYTTEELKEKCRRELEFFCGLFDKELQDRYYVFTHDRKLLQHDDPDTFQKIRDGEAYIEFTLRDGRGQVWSAIIDCPLKDDLVVLTINSHFNEEKYNADYVVCVE